MTALRILGLTAEPAEQFRTRTTRNSQLFNALERRYEVVAVHQPSVTGAGDIIDKVLHVHPDRSKWRGRFSLSDWRFRHRSEVAEDLLTSHAGEFDVVLQFQTLFAPGTRLDRKYFVYTDNIYPLTERWYPAWAPLTRRAGSRWRENERRVFAHAQTVFTKSDFCRRAIIDEYGIEPGRVVAVAAGSNSLPPELAPRRWDSQIALFVGAYWEIKAGPTLLEAWRRVRAELPEAELWIAGPRRPLAPEQDGVRWLGYVGGRDALASLYQQASVFVMPSLFEAWGLVFLEAMGNAVPCIGSNRCAMPEIIVDGETGSLVPAGEAEPLAEALVAILRDPARAEAMGRSGRDRVLRRFTWDHVAERMAPHLEAALG